MPDPALPHPEFPISVDAKVAEAVIALLQQDASLSTYFQTIREYELDELLLADTVATPALGVIIDGTAERRLGGNRQAELTTSVAFAYITDLPNRSGSQRWLRSRIFDQIKRVLAAQGGELHWQGNRVAEALIAFRRLSGAVEIASGAHLLTRAVAEFTSDIDEATREFIE